MAPAVVNRQVHFLNQISLLLRHYYRHVCNLRKLSARSARKSDYLNSGRSCHYRRIYNILAVSGRRDSDKDIPALPIAVKLLRKDAQPVHVINISGS